MSSLRAAAACGLSLLVAACRPNSAWIQLRTEGNSARDQGDFAGAVDRYRRALVARDLGVSALPENADMKSFDPADREQLGRALTVALDATYHALLSRLAARQRGAVAHARRVPD